ncbi:hypothetical protein [Nocardia callitridis]|uniref:Uncharacterized protein n=1 Tax=Nocardia callitridis TaxID=648753 RepID=A0ABP9JWD0_9NOCA
MDNDYFTRIPTVGTDSDEGLVEQLSDDALRRLARAASGLSIESQQYLADLAQRLRVTEGLAPREQVTEL